MHVYSWYTRTVYHFYLPSSALVMIVTASRNGWWHGRMPLCTVLRMRTAVRTRNAASARTSAVSVRDVTYYSYGSAASARCLGAGRSARGSAAFQRAMNPTPPTMATGPGPEVQMQQLLNAVTKEHSDAMLAATGGPRTTKARRKV